MSLEKLLENWDKRFRTDTLDEFRVHVETSLRRRQNRLDKEYSNLSPDQFEDPRDIDGYRMHLDEKMYEGALVQSLADELAIVALYRQAELHIKRVTLRNFPEINEKKLSEIEFVKKALPFKIETLPCYAAHDELRLINNSIKHEGKVSAILAAKFTSWKENEEFKELDDAYERLLPLIKKYVESFTIEAYAKSSRNKI